MNAGVVAGFALLLSIVVLLSATVVRLENYRYSNFVGFCSQYNIADPQQRIKREDCLNSTESRTHWVWHLLYGLRSSEKFVPPPRSNATALERTLPCCRGQISFA